LIETQPLINLHFNMKRPVNFFKQFWIGLRQEFQIFKHHPFRLVLFYIIPIILTIIHICLSNFHLLSKPPSPFLLDRMIDKLPQGQDHKYDKIEIILIDKALQPALYFAPAIILSQKLVKEHKFKVKDFLIVSFMIV